MQWWSRLGLTERNLAQVKNELRYDPQNESLHRFLDHFSGVASTAGL